MLNVFPALLTFRFLAPTIIRVVLGGLVVYLGLQKLVANKTIATEPAEKSTLGVLSFVATIEILSGLALIAGAYTQIAAIIVSVLTIIFSILKLRGKNPTGFPIPINTLILAAAISLVFSGAGLFAFDLPF